jgi:hypothetical protein
MYDDLALLLPVCEINKRLTRNARERNRLRTMLRIAFETREDAKRFGSEKCRAHRVDSTRGGERMTLERKRPGC